MGAVPEAQAHSCQPACLRKAEGQALQCDCGSCFSFQLVLAYDVKEHNALNNAWVKMLRCMAGWRRVSQEDWADTMRRMRQRVSCFLESAPCPDICSQVFLSKWRLAVRLLSGKGKWSESLLNLRGAFARRRGRPPAQWLDDIQAFCDQSPHGSIADALANSSAQTEYVAYCKAKYCS